MTQLVYEIDKLRATGKTAKGAFEAYAAERGLKAPNVQAAYYAQRKKAAPPEQASLSSELRALAARAQDLEDLVAKYEAITSTIST